jgi:outer membrane protein
MFGVKERFGMIILYILITLISAYLVYDHFSQKKKMGYIVIQDVYNQFGLKKDLQKKYETSHTARKRVLDSLAMGVRMIGQKIDAEKGKDTADIRLFKMKRLEFYQRQQTNGQDDSAQMKQYDEQILTQLDQYVNDYGKENNYLYILGNGGNGSIMHADESQNITAQVTQYVNERYEGKK